MILGTVFTYDVFISCSHADSEWVLRTLLPRLEDAGLKVCVDARDFRPGAARLSEVERAVTTSRKTLLILTPPYLADEWAESGNLMVQSLDPASRDLRMIPLLKERCEPPLRIRHLTYVNFADPDDPAWPWTQLLTALGAAPILEPPPAPARPGWFLPHPYGAQPNFTGRAAERKMLSDWLADRLPRPEPVEGPPHPLLILRALGGFGKSALAWHWLNHDVDEDRCRAINMVDHEADILLDLARVRRDEAQGSFDSARQKTAGSAAHEVQGGMLRWRFAATNLVSQTRSA